MRNRYALLLKMQMYNFLGINRMLHSYSRKEKRQSAVMGVLALVVLALMIACSAIFSVGVANMGAVDILPAISALVYSVITLVLTFLKSSGVLIGSRDYDMVMSLPVKSTDVILSRMTMVYLSNLFIGGIVVLPAVVVFGWKADLGMAANLIFLLSLPFMPMIPMIISLGVGGWIAAVSSRSKHKDVLSLVFSTLAVLLFVAASIQVRNLDSSAILNIGLAWGNTAARIYPPAALISTAVQNQNWSCFFAFAGLSIGIGGVFVVVAAHFYPMMNTAAFRHSSIQYTGKAFKVSSPVKAMYKREFERYFSCTIYALNSTIGMVLLLAISVLSLFISPEMLEQQSGFAGLSPILRQILPMGIAVCISMTSTTAASLSLEGKSRWLMCSVPVRAIDILNSKIAVNLTVIFPFASISILLLDIRMKTSPMLTILSCVVPLVYACFISVLGMYMNVKFPKYDWTSEYYAIKGGAVSVLGTMGVGMLSSLVPLLVCVVFTDVSGIVMAVASAILSLITLALYRKLSSCRLYEI